MEQEDKYITHLRPFIAEWNNTHIHVHVMCSWFAGVGTQNTNGGVAKYTNPGHVAKTLVTPGVENKYYRVGDLHSPRLISITATLIDTYMFIIP